MKSKMMKRILSMFLGATVAMGSLIGCGGQSQEPVQETTQTPAEEHEEENVSSQESKGTIMWLVPSEQKAIKVGFEDLCEEFGYKPLTVYGDPFNDAAGNLAAVRNSMTSDVVAIITSADGGITDIMEEYPDLYVAGTLTDMYSVYSEGGENAGILENDHYLGTLVDGTVDPADTAQMFFDQVIEKGYKKLAVVNFPSYAYPNQGEIDAAFKQLVEEYNANASEEEKVVLVGETTTLEFSVLSDSWFLEEGHNDLDCIIGICSGVSFIYPTLITAKANGMCSPDTKLITVGFTDDSTFLYDVGEDKTISWVAVSSPSPMVYPMVLIDNALNGTQYSDWKNDRVDMMMYVVDSVEDAEIVRKESVNITFDVDDLPISADVAAQYLTRNNPDATYQDLLDLMYNEEYVSVDALYNR